MKRVNIAYWIITGLFSAFMIYSSTGGVTLDEQAVAFLHDHLGYPLYFIRIISVAKILGAIAILIPGWPRVKEWAYFGFFIDLVTAVLSLIAVGDPASGWALMFIFIAVLIASYLLHHRRLNAKA